MSLSEGASASQAGPLAEGGAASSTASPAKPSVPSAGDTFTIDYPFVRDTYTAFDEEGCCEAQTWRPGVRFVPLPPYGEDSGAVADGIGIAHFEVISIHKPAHYPARVFFTRRFQTPRPEKRWFGKTKLHIVTLEKFRRLTRGYQHQYGIGEPLEPRYGQRAAREVLEQMLAEHAASGTSGSAQDSQGLDPKGAGPTAEGGDARKEQP